MAILTYDENGNEVDYLSEKNEEIKAALEKREWHGVTLEEKIELALLQLETAILDKGERVAVCEARKQIAMYFKGYKGVAQLRARINQALTFDEVKDILSTL